MLNLMKNLQWHHMCLIITLILKLIGDQVQRHLKSNNFYKFLRVISNEEIQ